MGKPSQFSAHLEVNFIFYSRSKIYLYVRRDSPIRDADVRKETQWN
jgi:hypothetical protein